MPLPPKPVPQHPRLSRVPAIHFDHFNSSVIDLAGPRGPDVRAELVSHRCVLGMCLNFLLGEGDGVYAFCGKLFRAGLRVSFSLTRLDTELHKVDDYELTQLRSLDLLRGDLPLNLGYFVMMHDGSVIGVENDTDIVFLTDGPAGIEATTVWDMRDEIRNELGEDYAEQPLAQVLPAHGRGYWLMAMGSRENERPGYVGKLSDEGALEGAFVFPGEVIANGLAVDETGVYVLTNFALYKLEQNADGGVQMAWPERVRYERATEIKPGTEDLSRHGSGSTPTLLGAKNDLVAITDNADGRVNLLVHNRSDGSEVCKEPLFEPGKSANENSVLGYGDSIVVQNWHNAPAYNKDMWDMSPGLWRLDVAENRSGCKDVWKNDEFASTGTIRLSTKTGLLYGTVQTAEDDRYALALIDFQTGGLVQQVPMPGHGRGYRTSMAPAYFLPGGAVVQPVRRGMVVFRDG